LLLSFACWRRSEFHFSRLARTKALKKWKGRRALADMAKLSTARPAWLGSCEEVVIMESGKIKAQNFMFTKYTNP